MTTMATIKNINEIMENLQNQNQQNNFNQIQKQTPKKQIPSWIGFVIIFIFIAITFGGVFSYQYYAKSQQNSEFLVSRPKTNQTQNQTAGWKTYTDSEYGFEFNYPPLVSIKQENGSAVASHSIIYKHPDACDLVNDSSTLDKLSDFGVSFRVFNKDLKETFDATNYVLHSDDFVENNTLKLSQGFIDKYNVGSLNGFQIVGDKNGCGSYSYYFPISPTKTLVVDRLIVIEFKPIIYDYQKYLNLPGVILPSREDDYFNGMLSTFKFTK